MVLEMFREVSFFSKHFKHQDEFRHLIDQLLPIYISNGIFDFRVPCYTHSRNR
jgi:hypothetical protein